MCQEKLPISFIKYFFLVFTSIIIGACSFRPLYMVNSAENKPFTIQPDIKITALSARHGAILKNHLIDALKPSSHADFSLSVNLVEDVTDIGIRKDETAGRKQTKVIANILLYKTKDNTIVYSHTVNSINAFTLQENKYYAAQTAEDFAMQQNILELANKIALHLNIYFSTRQ